MEGFLQEVTHELPDEREEERNVGEGTECGRSHGGVLRWWQGLTRPRWLHGGGWLRERVAQDEGERPAGAECTGP